mmetsp:Transcript_87629/g.237567  ORF Transcript_87629/g.237567 Transcript_87629/m.237567 type:complete len:215 (+) Transcript_87629:505-1149(+)
MAEQAGAAVVRPADHDPRHRRGGLLLRSQGRLPRRSLLQVDAGFLRQCGQRPRVVRVLRAADDRRAGDQGVGTLLRPRRRPRLPPRVRGRPWDSGIPRGRGSGPREGGGRCGLQQQVREGHLPARGARALLDVQLPVHLHPRPQLRDRESAGQPARGARRGRQRARLQDGPGHWRLLCGAGAGAADALAAGGVLRAARGAAPGVQGGDCWAALT